MFALQKMRLAIGRWLALARSFARSLDRSMAVVDAGGVVERLEEAR